MGLAPFYEHTPTKTGSFDDFLVVGLQGREWISKLVQSLYLRSHGDIFLFEFSLRDLERAWAKSARRLQLGALKLSPHCLRHGGPSHDILHNTRSLEQVRRRGFWKSMQSVERY